MCGILGRKKYMLSQMAKAHRYIHTQACVYCTYTENDTHTQKPYDNNFGELFF